jgi:hypothetical protein
MSCQFTPKYEYLREMKIYTQILTYKMLIEVLRAKIGNNPNKMW